MSSDHSAATNPSTCPGNCTTTQGSAIDYMRAEILWSTIYMNAWSDTNLLDLLVKHKHNANALIEELGKKYQLPVKVPPGVTLKIVFDATNEVHLVMPAFQHIPPSNLDMVPHAL